MTDKNIDQLIEETMMQAALPESVQKRLKKTTDAVRISSRTDPDSGNTIPFRAQKKSIRKRHRWRTAWVAAAVVACSGITVFAAAKYYRFHVDQQAKYEVEIGVTSEDSAAGTSEADTIESTEVPVVEMNVGYLPDGLIDNSEEKGDRSFKQPDEQGGFFIGDPLIMDTSEGTWSEAFVQEHEMVPIGDKEALYVCSQRTADPDWLWQDLYIPFPEVDRIVLLSGWGHASKEELLQIAESITMTPTGETTEIKGQTTWSDYLKYKQGAASDPDPEPAEGKQLTASAQEMANLHRVGDSVVRETRTNDRTEMLPVKISVIDVQIADDLSLLKDVGQIGALEQWRTLVKADGTLEAMKRQYFSHGDGKDTLSRIIKEENVAPKLVFITLEYTNETEQDMQDVYFFGSLLRIGEENGVYRILTPDLQGADDVAYTVWAGTGEMQYYDMSDAETGKNYIPEIKAGESQIVHMAWLVGEDEADHLYLSLNSASWDCFTEDMLQEGLFQLQNK